MDDERDFYSQLPDLILNCPDIPSGMELTHQTIQFGKHCWVESRRTLREKLKKKSNKKGGSWITKCIVPE